MDAIELNEIAEALVELAKRLEKLGFEDTADRLVAVAWFLFDEANDYGLN